MAGWAQEVDLTDQEHAVELKGLTFRRGARAIFDKVGFTGSTAAR